LAVAHRHQRAPVQAAIKMMLDERLFALASRHITVSSVGVIPKIGALARDFPRVSFALSLHAPTQELRERIVPSAKAHKLDKLMAAIKGYQNVTGQKVFIEYVLLDGVNDGVAIAAQLGELLKGHHVTVNLIPWNPVLSPDMHFGAPGLEQVRKFQKVLRQDFGIACTVRQEKGQEILGACGQLVVQTKSGPGAIKGLADIEEVAARLLSKAALVR
jgi:adenine C2-methylase RlmN of 23S rRNA A2503 and tRNA A37